MTKLEDLDFADDIALLLSTQQHAQAKITKLNQYAGLNTQAYAALV